MRNIIWLTFIFTCLSFGLFAQTATSPPSGSATYSSPTDSRSIGWTGGKTYYDTNSNWQSFVSPCLSFGFNDTLSDIINGNNTLPPNQACSGMSDVVYSAASSDLANGIIVFRGTTTYYYMTTGNYYTTNSNIPVRVTIDFDRAVSYYNSMLLIQVDTSFSYNVIYECYSPSGANYISGGANTWTPAIKLFDNLHTSTSRSICTSFSEGDYYTFSVQDSAWDNGNGSYSLGDSIILFSNNENNRSYLWSGPNSFQSTQAFDTILNATSADSGAYYLTATDDFGCPNYDTLNITVNSSNISVTSVSSTSLCPASAIDIIFSASGTYNSNNVFTAQLSYPNDSFNNPITIGTINASAGDTINGIISDTMSAGSSYKLRVIASNPAINGTEFGNNITIHPKPNSDFTFADECLDDAVSFTNTSTVSSGSINSYLWDFNDNGNSTQASPDHKYNNSGTYSVKLIITSDNSCKDTVSKSVTVYPKPVANYTFTNACLDDGISFTNTSSVSSGSITAYAWNFGDGNNSSAASPSHMYAASGTYTVQLIVTTNNSCKDTVSKSVIVYPKPVANYTFANACLDDGISFTNSSTVSSGSITGYAWSFGDGNNSSAASPSHMYAASGTYTVQLIVTTNNSCKDTVSKSVTVYPKPTANYTFANACLDDGISFTNTSSVSSGSITAYAWDFGDGDNSSTASPSHMYATSGTYTVQLIVTTNNSCKDTVSKSVTVYPKPVANYTFTNACLDDGISFTNTSSVSSGSITAYAWDFGDGNNSSTASSSHMYAASGTFTVQLIVTTNNSCKDTVSKSVTVYPKPTANYTFANACLDDGISFTNTSSVSSGSITAYAWDFGDGNNSSTASPSHMYAASGTYTVQLIVTTINSCKDTVSKSVTVYPKPVAGFSTSNVCYGLNMNFTDTSTISGGSITNYAWTFGDGNTSSVANPSHMYAASGTYNVQLIITSNVGCKDTVSTTVTVYPKPVADYTFTNQCLDEGITFTDASTVSSGSITAYAWNFGDSKTSSLQNPYHYYTASGSYSVTLLITTNNSCLDTVVKSATVYPKPDAIFTTANQCQYDSVGFANSSTVSSGSIVNHSWDFDDGATSTFISPKHKYDSAATFDVILVTTTNNGCKDTVTNSVTVNPQPIADFVFTAGCVNEIISFTDSSKVISGIINSYLWNMGDFSGNVTVKNPLHLYNSEGTYSVKLIVTTDSSCYDTAIKSIKVAPVPVASFTTANSCLGDSTSLTNNSTISSGTIDYVWDFGDGSSSTSSNPKHLYAAAGSYTITLTATSDNFCEDIYTSTVTIYPMPTAYFAATNNCYGQSITFNNYSTISSATLSYLWDFDDANSSTTTSPSHMYSASGMYNVKLLATSAFGCKDSVTTAVTVYDKPLSSFTANNACENTSVAFTNTSTIASGSITHAWDFGDNSSSSSSSPNHSYTSDGSYSVVLISTSNNGCIDTATSTLTIYEVPVASFTVSNVCDEDSASFINTSTISSGTNTYIWSFGDGDSSTSMSPKHHYASAGTYTIYLTVTSNNSCADMYSAQVTVNPQPVVSFTAADVCDGSVMTFNNSSSISSGNNSYVWTFGDGNSSNNTSPTHTYASSGTYSVLLTATSDKGCVADLTKQVEVYPQPVAEFTTANVCAIDSVSFVNTSSISGGTISYKWNFGDSDTSVLTNPVHMYANAGTYTVSLTITSDKGCMDYYSSTVTLYPQPVADFSTNDTCNGNHVIYVNNSRISNGTNSYLWTYGDGNSSNNVSPTHTYPTTGTYSVMLVATSNNGCVDSAIKSVTIHPKPIVTFTTANVCFGDSVMTSNTSSISAGSMTYYWNFGDGSNSTSSSPSHLYAAAGTYTISLLATSNNGCQNSYSTTVTVYPAPAASFNVSDACYGYTIAFQNTSSVSSGSNTFAWDLGDGSSTNNVSPTHLYASSGMYSAKLLATTDKGCVDSVAKNVSVHPEAISSFTASNVCDGDTVHFINSSSVSSGTMSYLWNFGDGNGATAKDTNYIYSAPGTYIVKLTVTTDKGCATTSSMNITIYPRASLAFTTNNMCDGNSAVFTNTTSVSNGSLNYIWDFGDNSTSNNISPTHLYAATATYQVILYAYTNNGCMDSLLGSITIYPQPIAKFGTLDVCDGENVLFADSSSISSGSMTYTWTFGDGNSSTGQNPQHQYAASGTYTVVLTVTSDKGCTDVYTSSVTVNPMPLPNFSATNVCIGNTIAFSNSTTVSSGSNSYLWYFGDGNTSANSSPNHAYTTPGSYDVKLIVTTDKGCMDSITKQVVVYPEPVAGYTTANVCDGSAMSFNNTSTISSGTMTYAWNFGDGNSSTQMSPTHTYAGPGTFTVKLTVTSNNSCTDIFTKDVTVYHVPVAAFTTSNVCFGTSVSFINNSTLANGSMNYIWDFDDGDSSISASPTHYYAADGIYNVLLTVSSTFGCIDTQLIDVEVYPLPVSTLSAVDITCSGMKDGHIVVHALSGSAPYMFALNGGSSQLDSNFFNLQKGNFQVVVTDDHGCSSSASGSIAEPDRIRISLNGTDLTCKGDNSGLIQVIASGGTGTLTYSKDGGQTFQSSNTFNNLASAYYVIAIKDANGCSQSQGITLTEPLNGIDISIASMQDVSCKGDLTGSVAFNSNGGTGIPDFSIDGINYQSASKFTALAAGNYIGSVQDQNGCSNTVNFMIDEPAMALSIDNISVVDVSCYGDESASLSFVASGGTPYYMYSIDAGSNYTTSSSFTNLDARTYATMIIDSLGCTVSQSVKVEEPNNPLSLTIVSTTNSNCPTDESGSFEISANGGTPAYSFSIDGTNYQASGVFTGLNAEDYMVYIIDNNSCSFTDIVSIDFDNPAPVAAFDFIVNNNAVSFINRSQNATNYSWDFDDGNTSSQISPVHIYSNSGQYDVKLIAINMCTSDTFSSSDNSEYIPIQKTGFEELGEGSGIALKLYPNPTEGKLIVQFLRQTMLDEIQVRVNAIDGRNVYDSKYDLHQSSGQIIIDLENVYKGAYMLEIRSKNHVYNKLIIKK
jgi:PKD repeat protein